MKKFLIVLASLIVLFYLTLSLALKPLTAKAIAIALRDDEKHGVKISELTFKNAYVSSYKGLTWSALSAKFQFISNDKFLEKRQFEVSLDKLTLRLKNLKQRKFGLKVDGLDVKTIQLEDEEKDKLEYVEGQNLEIKFVLDFLNPSTIPNQVKSWIKGLGDLMLTGRTTWPVEFSGATYITFRGQPAKIRLSVKREGDLYALVMYQQDLKSLASRMREQVTDAEIDLIAKYPLRAPALLKLSDYASKAAAEANKKEPDVSENTYRHVVWSYLLTRQYGERFAIEVTNAHEATDNEGDRDIDLRNNLVGRSYALKGMPEKSILARLLTDPNAVLDASEWPKMKYRKFADPAKQRVPQS
jgi:hypothetical protein